MSSLIDIAGIRKDYKLKSFTEADAAADPVIQFRKWWDEAASSKIEEYNAMTLATSSPDGKPSARIVLLKGFSSEGFVFYTNYRSKKGVQILDNPNVALVVFWKELERQIRIEGTVIKSSDSDSDLYFRNRPVNSQIGAWASPQSEQIMERDFLDNRMKEFEKEFAGKEVPRPPHWGGFVVKPELIEFWQGRTSRLHDRIVYTFNEQKAWIRSRLAP